MTISYSKLFVGISLPALCTGLAGLILCSSAHAQTIRPSTQKELKVFDPTASATGNVGIRAAAGTVSYTLTLPAAEPSVNQVLSVNAVSVGSVSLTWATPFSGTGTTNYLSKFADAGTLTNSLLFDNGTNVGIGSITPTARLEVRGTGTTSATTALDVENSASTSLLTVRNDGNVGIGTTSPALKLHIKGVTGYPAISGTSQTGIGRFDSNSSSNVLDIGQAHETPYGLWLQGTDRSNLSFEYPILLNPNGGNVGIGTTDPSTLLHLRSSNPTLTITSGTTTGTTIGNKGNRLLLLSNSSTVNNGGEIVFGATDAPAYRWGAISGGITNNSTSGAVGNILFATKETEAGTALSERMVITSSGNVGIGSITPNARLEVRGAGSTSATTALDVENSNGTSLLTVYDDGRVGIGGMGASSLVHIASSSPWLTLQRITTGGSSLLTFTDPSNTRVGYVGTATNEFYITNELLNSPIRFLTNGGSTTERMRITSGGEVYIGNNPADQGTYNLQVNGTGVWGAGAYTSGSDSALKYNIQPLESSLDVVKQMKPVTFEYKPFYSKDTATQTGFIAQDLQQLLADKTYKNGVIKENGVYLGVAYENIIPLLVKAIQEQQVQLDQLKADQAATSSLLRQLQLDLQSIQKPNTVHKE